MKRAAHPHSPSLRALLAGAALVVLAGLPAVTGTQGTDAVSAPDTQHGVTVVSAPVVVADAHADSSGYCTGNDDIHVVGEAAT